MDAAKRKNSELNIKRYWLIYIPITIIMLLSLRFPLRIFLTETLSDVIFYGALSYGFFRSAYHVYRLSKWKFRPLLAVIIFCSALSAWHVFDLAVLREIDLDAFIQFNGYYGYGTTHHRFSRSELGCELVAEGYIGNIYIAIVKAAYLNTCENE
jgi:hypothetical protein